VYLLATLTEITACLQGQLTVANGVLFGTTSSSDDSPTASLFALNVTDGTILTAVTLNNTLVQNGPSIVNNILYQGAGERSPHAGSCHLYHQTKTKQTCMQCDAIMTPSLRLHLDQIMSPS